MKSESIADLADEICQLAKGPARPVFKKAPRRWLEVHKQALRKDLPRLFPYPADQSDPSSPDPKQPLPPPNVKQGCAVLAAVHDENCPRCVTLFPAPKAKDDPVGHAVWKQLRRVVSEKPDPSYVRKILDSVRIELQKWCVLLTGEDETPTAAPTPTDAETAKDEANGGGDVTATAKESIDEKGEVRNPRDPTAYVSAKEILTKHTPVEIATTHKQLIKVLEDQPKIRRWRWRTNRLSIHLSDWSEFVQLRMAVVDGDGLLADEAQIEARKAEIDRTRERGK